MTAAAPQSPPLDHAPQTLSTGLAQYHFMAWLPQGIVGPKMATFLADQDARVLELDANHVRLQIGRKTWLGWSKRETELPLEMSVTLDHGTICARSTTYLVAEMRPLVKAPVEQVRRRFNHVARSLRDCLLAQEVEPGA